jgi:hypothetical protein
MADRKITVAIDADTTGFRRGVSQAEDRATGLRGKFESMAGRLGGLPGIGIATAAIGGLTVALTQSVQAAAEEEQAVATLAAVLGKALPDASAEAKAAIDAQVESMQYGSSFVDDQLRPAYGALVSVVRDQALAFTLLQASMDLATAKGVPLETATRAVAKAADGQTGALAKLAPELDGNALKGATARDIAQQLATKFGGVDKAAADTSQGRIKDLNKRFDDMSEAVGTALLPALEDFTDWAASPDGQAAIKSMTDALVAMASAFATIAGVVGPLIGLLQDLDEALRSLPNAGAPLDNIRDWFGLRSAGGAPAGGTGPSTYGASTTSASRPSVSVSVSGALDPDSVARQVERMLAGHAHRVGRAPYTPRPVAW